MERPRDYRVTCEREGSPQGGLGRSGRGLCDAKAAGKRAHSTVEQWRPSCRNVVTCVLAECFRGIGSEIFLTYKVTRALSQRFSIRRVLTYLTNTTMSAL